MAITKEINGKKITFDLSEWGDGIAVIATNINGEREYGGHLIHIQKDGTYSRVEGVNGEFGFSTNAKGQIKQNKQ
jgi:hypothetical protein